MKTITQILIVCFLLVFMAGCSKSGEVAPDVSVDQVLATWQLKTMKVMVKVNDNGKVETANDSRNGTSRETVEFRNTGTLLDPSDLFGTGRYSWKYAIKGSELALGEPGNIGYFTIRTSGTTMTWHMNLEQGRRSLKDTRAFSSIFNVDADEVRDALIDLDFTIEFVKK